MSEEVVIGWATAWHEECFVKAHPHNGKRLLALMRERHWSNHLYDASGASVGLVSSYDEDCCDETGQPMSCDYCNGYLVDDERTPEHPLSQNLLNLTNEVREPAFTVWMSNCAYIARQYETDVDELSSLMHLAAYTEYPQTATWPDYAKRVVELTAEWVNSWTNREVIQLQQDESGLYRMVCGLLGNEPDPERPGMWRGVWSKTPNEREDWHEYDMRGYLDMWDEGDSACASCGRRIESHCYHAEDDSDAYCPDCVTVE